jgi:hypothetical protein
LVRIQPPPPFLNRILTAKKVEFIDF